MTYVVLITLGRMLYEVLCDLIGSYHIGLPFMSRLSILYCTDFPFMVDSKNLSATCTVRYCDGSRWPLQWWLQFQSRHCFGNTTLAPASKIIRRDNFISAIFVYWLRLVVQF